ncbi:MAG: LysR family transcriptional regulator [Oscillospiraceae bacterium]
MFNPQLKAFVTAADCGSFTKAAEKLFISPTAVMKQINALEDHLGLKLMLVTIPVEWDHTIPYGILFAKDPPEDVKRLIQIVREML